MSIPLTDVVRDAVADSLGDAYDCIRTWDAWQVGTMTQYDFLLVSNDTDRIEEIAQAAVDALPPVYSAAPEMLAEIERECIDLIDFANSWPGRDTPAGQMKLGRLRDLIVKATGRTVQEVQDDYGCRAALARGEA